MTTSGITRRTFGVALTAASAGLAVPALWTSRAEAADAVREGIQIGALGALRSTLAAAGKPYDLTFDVKDFRDSTSALLAIEQGELEISNTTTQHLIRAISENIPVKWVCGWGGGYNVLVAQKGLNLTPNDSAALQALVASRKQSGKPVIFGVPTGSLQHAKLAVYLKSIQVDPDKDVVIANIPFANHPRALDAGEVDLAMTFQRSARSRSKTAMRRCFCTCSVGASASKRSDLSSRRSSSTRSRNWCNGSSMRMSM